MPCLTSRQTRLDFGSNVAAGIKPPEAGRIAVHGNSYVVYLHNTHRTVARR
jgi:hypothetical protein